MMMLFVKKIASSDISQVILEETGQQAQSTIIIDTIMVVELQVEQQHKQQIVVLQVYLMLLFM